MVKEKVGIVTEEEKEEILKLYERKLALSELLPTVQNTMLTLEEQEKLYEKIVNDIGKTKYEVTLWFRKMSEAYRWKNHPKGQWNIDFQTREIYLVYEEESAV